MEKPVPILKVLSIVPLGFNLIIPLRVTPLYEIKPPPANILPSGCNAIVIGKEYNPKFKPVPPNPAFISKLSVVVSIILYIELLLIGA